MGEAGRRIGLKKKGLKMRFKAFGVHIMIKLQQNYIG